MQTSSQPKLLPIPFADAGTKQDIPNESQVGIAAGRASYSDGFPPLTRTPLAAGGVPPFGTDFNGVFNDITTAIRWAQAGAGYPFNTTFSSAVSGYPKGAKIPNSTLDGFWLNTVDGNTASPENLTSALTGWVPAENYGTTAITGLAGSTVTLSTLQASKERLILSGSLTANINIIVPAWVKRWTIVNNSTGSFSVTVKTPNGAGISIPSGLVASVYGDGTNIKQDASLLGYPGRLINIQTITVTGTYTPTPGTTLIEVELVGGSGGTGGCSATSATTSACTSPGCQGTYAMARYSNPAATTVTIGAGGAPGGTSGQGSTGGTSTFGSLLTCPGGQGSYAVTPTSGTITSATGSPSAAATGSGIVTSISGRGVPNAIQASFGVATNYTAPAQGPFPGATWGASVDGVYRGANQSAYNGNTGLSGGCRIREYA